MPIDSPEALSSAFATAIAAADVDAAMALWHEDAAIVQADGQSVRGHDAIATALHALLDHGASLDIHLAHLHAGGDVAIGTGTLTITVPDGNGDQHVAKSDSVVVYTRNAKGEWRIAIDAPWGLPR